MIHQQKLVYLSRTLYSTVKGSELLFQKKIKFLSKENKKEIFPVGTIGEGDRKITVFFNHYNSNEDTLNKWNNRVTRIYWDNIFVIMSDQNGCTDEIARKFDELKIKFFILVEKLRALDAYT